jgi:hypothetical protein
MARCRLWTADKRLQGVAREMHIEYSPRSSAG